MCFFVARDALDAVDRVLVKNAVVANPEFEGKAGTDGNEAVKVVVVAQGPGKAAEKD